MLRILDYLRIAIGFIIPLSLLAESTGKPGPEKRIQVVEDLRHHLAALNISYPVWMDRFIEPLLGLCVDVVIDILNQMAFFTHGNESLPD